MLACVWWCPTAPPDLRSAVAQVADISGKAEHTLEFPVMAVASSSTSAPTSITGHDKQPSTVTLLLSPSNHVPSAANASDSPVSESQIAGATQDTPIDLEKLVNECAVTAAEEAVISASYIKESSGEETAPIVDIMREAAVSAALVAARAAVAAVAGTVFFALVRFLYHAGTGQEHF